MLKFVSNLFLITCFFFVSVLTVAQDEFLPLDDGFVSLEAFEDSTSTSACANCTSCTDGNFALKAPFKEFSFVLAVLILSILLLVKKHKLKTLFWSIGLYIFGSLIFLVAQQNADTKHKSVGEELEVVQTEQFSTEAEPTSDLESDDEFEEFSSTDEFDEFSSGDEFEEFETFEALETDQSTEVKHEESEDRFLSKSEQNKLIRTLIALLATLLAGFVFYKPSLHYLRYAFLLSGLLYLGFYSGGCPCMISSFQSLVLVLLGESIAWINLVWIIGLIILTYFFGKVWCGWICHLGALQEFLYKKNNIAFLRNPITQKILNWTRIVAFIALLVQLILTRSNIFIKIDPFKVAFNLFSANTTGYVLLVIMLVSSLFVYRPFCKAFCPVGLILGWVSKLPKASLLQVNSSCKSCNKCNKACDYNAISVVHKTYSVLNSECIRCGACVSNCNFKSINIQLNTNIIDGTNK